MASEQTRQIAGSKHVSSAGFSRRPNRPHRAKPCYACGAKGGDCRLRSRPGPASQPFFPFLEYHEASPGSAIHSDGTVDVCKVCLAFLIGQWDSYERNNTPIVKRLYWLKRLDFSQSSGSKKPEPHVSTTPVRDEMYKRRDSSPRSPRGDNGYRREIPTTPVSCTTTTSIDKQQRRPSNNTDVHVPSVAVCYGCGVSTSKHAIRIVHTSHWSKSEDPYFPCILGHSAPSGSRPVDHLGRVLMCDPCTVYLLRQWHNYERDSVALHQRKYHLRSEGDLVTEGLPTNSSTKSGPIVCFLCSQTMALSNIQLVRATRSNASEPYYPFLEKHSPPRGSICLSKDGLAQVCTPCSKDLYEQWNAHELTHTPHGKRSYRLSTKCNSNSSGAGSGKEKVKVEKQSRNEACYLCGKITAHSSLKTVNTLAPDQSRTHTMYFPFITNVKRPPKAKAIDKDGKASACSHCCNQLEQQWTLYQGEGIPHNERRYMIQPNGANQSNGIVDTYTGISPSKPKKQSFSNGVCFLCGVHGDPAKLNKLHSYPRRTLDEIQDSTPFFPFLASRNPAPGSNPIDVEGTVRSCLFCFFNLIAQWHDYDNSKSFADSNRWLRRYYVNEFVCYTCGDFASRDDVRTVSTDDFPSMLHIERPKGGIVLDQGTVLVTCSACEMALSRQKRKFDHAQVPEEKRRYKLGKPDTSLKEVRYDRSL